MRQPARSSDRAGVAVPAAREIRHAGRPVGWENARVSELDFRRPTSDEIADILRIPLRSYGADGSDAEVADELLPNEIDRSIGAFDGDRCVAGAGAFSFSTTLPGGAVVPAAGVTMVGLEPTHRRRGILTELLRRLHGDARERGEPVALLTASETTIYRRFGYGITADVAHLTIRADAVRFDPPLADPGSFRPVDPQADTSVLEAVHELVRPIRTGWLTVTAGMWARYRTPTDHHRPGRTPLRGVVHVDASGEPDGYALWRIGVHDRTDRLASNTVYLEHLTATSPEVEAALWGFVASIDLVTTVEFECGPADPWIRWRLAEPRQLRTEALADMVWGRLLDVPAVLSARTYGAAGELTLAVTDRFHPELGGRFRLSCTARGAPGRCERIADGSEVAADHRPDSTGGGADADLTLDTADAASITLGGVAPSQLAAAGRVRGSAAAVDLADALFALPGRPWWPIEF